MPEVAAIKKVKKKVANPSSQEIKIDSSKVYEKITLGNIEKEEEKNLLSFFSEISKKTIIDTGIIPLDGTGMLSHRHAFDSTQIVYQQKPGMYHVYWGAHEGTQNKEVFYLAQPWRVWIADLFKGELLGIRHFYSPVPVQSLEQQLYHVNLPNLNCQGYNNTSVGWICLYHNHQWGDIPIGDKIRKLAELAGGGEAYNDGNMNGTDGPRFYAKKNKPKYVIDPNVWEKKTQEEGYEWTLDLDLWIPVLVTSLDSQDKHDNNGVPLTLDMAMKGHYKAYYTDANVPKPFNSFSRLDIESPSTNEVIESLHNAFSLAKKDFTGGDEVKLQPAEVLIDPDLVVMGECVSCNVTVYKKDIDGCATDNSGLWCQSCVDVEFGKCNQCYLPYHFDTLQYYHQDGVFYCTNCKTIHVCKTCGQTHMDEQNIIADAYCIQCTNDQELAVCDICTKTNLLANFGDPISALDINETIEDHMVCNNCSDMVTVCGCKYIRPNEAIIAVDNNGISCCSICAYYDDTTGLYTYKDPNALPVGLINF